MYSLKNYQISTLILFQLNLLITITLVKSYTIPEPLFEVLKPQGIRISIPASNSPKEQLDVTSTINPLSEKSKLILNEDFQYLNESLWSREIKIPLKPDYEFCVYHNDHHPNLVKIVNGVLRIQPIILEDAYGVNVTSYGQLNLAGCTSNIPQECSQTAMAFNILPPIISARLTTKTRFSLKYGKIEIRAKFPEGDWLYPELWLEPLYSMYGPNYASGRVILGFTRGNVNLMTADLREIIDARRLEFGLRSGSPTINEEIVYKIMDRGSEWNKDFHVYTTIWNENGFEFLVDGEEIGSLTPTTEGSWLHHFNISSITKISPFDQEFYISIGVGVGGRRVFPDQTISSGYVKPWKNVGAKAMLQFWNSRNQWLPNWKRENGRKTALEVDYVKVWSL
ncbi:hypothetical protein M0802_013582 [Mischocyttarus mexicanus]|nr:hypothetical protein M0802_013582 [Mischocyttarus mexicanus]